MTGPVRFVVVDAELASVQPGQRITLDDDDVHHLRRVLRLADGQSLAIGDGAGRRVDAILDGSHAVVDGPVQQLVRLMPALTVLQGMPKARKLDTVVRMLTELAVDRIVVVDAQRSVAKLDANGQRSLHRRLVAVRRSAARQAGNAFLPALDGPTPLGEIELASDAVLLVPHVHEGPAVPAVQQISLADAVLEHGDAPHLALAIGPEGGWSPDEVDHLVARGGIVVGLGPTVLRTEHAGAVAAGVAAAMTGRWSKP